MLSLGKSDEGLFWRLCGGRTTRLRAGTAWMPPSAASIHVVRRCDAETVWASLEVDVVVLFFQGYVEHSSLRWSVTGFFSDEVDRQCMASALAMSFVSTLYISQCRILR